MAKGGTIEYGIKFNLDKNGIENIKTALRNIQKELQQNESMDFSKSIQGIKDLENILNSSWNSKLNQLDLSKVNTQIKNTYGSVQNLKQAVESSGAAGKNAYNTFANSVLNTNLQLKESSKVLNDLANTMANTIKWGIASSVVNNISNSINKAWKYSVNLDSSLNDIRIVASKSADEMERFADRANRVAKSLGSSTLDYTNASLIYYQQGLSDKEAAARAEVTLKAANVTGQTGQEVSEQLTAVWNGYKVTAEEAELYVDKLAAVAAATASDLEELSTGMSKVASAADLMGVDIDQLNATLATVVSVTRQAPESVGTAFKTIYARMGDIEAGLDAETTLGSYTEKMKEIAGINVLDANNQLRDMGEVIEEVGNKWTTLSREQQVALSQAMAGTRQYNNLLSLFDNWDMYQEALSISEGAAGTLQQQQDTYMESVEAHLQKLRTEADRTYQIIFDPETSNTLIDVLTSFIETFNDFIEGLGGGLNVILNIGMQIANLFNKQIGQSIERQIENVEIWKRNKDSLAMKKEVIDNNDLWSSDTTKNEVKVSHESKGEYITDNALQEEANIAERILNIRKALTTESYKELTSLQQQVGLLQTKLDTINKYNNKYKESSSTLEGNKEYYEYELSQQEKMLTYLELGTKSFAEQGAKAKIVNDIMNEIHSENSDMSTILAGVSVEQSQLLEEVQTNAKLSEQDVLNLTEKQKNLIDEQKKKILDLTNAIKAKKDIENGTNIEYQNQIDNIKQIITETENRAKREIALQNVISITTGLIQAMSSLIGGLSVAFDETSNASQKLNGYWSAGVGTLSSIANILLPGSGIIVQGLGSILKSGLEITGIWDSWENSLKSTEERLEELNNELKEIRDNEKNALSEYNKNSDTITYFEEIEDRFKVLQDLAEKGLLSPSLRNEYEGYLKKVQEYNQEALISYDSQGKLISLNNDIISDTLKKIKEENKLLLQNTYSNENWGMFSENFQKQYKEIYNTDTINSLGSSALLSLEYVEPYLNEEEIEQYKEIFNSENILKYSQDIDAWKNKINETISSFTNKVAEELQTTGQQGPITSDYLTLQTYLDQYEEKLKDFSKNFDKIKINSNDFLNYLKYNTEDNSAYEELVELGITNVDELLTGYIEGIDIGSTKFQDKYNNLDPSKIKEHLKDTEQKIVDLFKGINGTDLLDIYKKTMEEDTSTLSSQDYENFMINQITEFLSKIDNEEIFNRVKDILPNLFSLDSVSAEWKDGKAQLGANGGNIVTKGEGIARSIGQNISSNNFEDNTEIATQIESYLQNNLNEVDLQNLDTEKLSQDFNNLLYGLIGESGNINPTDIENILEESISAQNINTKDLGIDNALAKYSSSIEESGLETEELKEYATYISDIADETDDLSDSLTEDADAAVLVAKSIMRMNNGVEALNENQEEWIDILKESSKSSEKYWKSLEGIRDAYGDLLDLTEDQEQYLDGKFFVENADLIKDAANGSAEAIDSLKRKTSEKILVEIGIDNEWDEVSLKSFQTMLDSLWNNLPDLTLTPGMNLTNLSADQAAFIAACNDLIKAAGFTRDQANALFGSMGFDVKFKKSEEPVEYVQPQTITQTTVTGYTSGTAEGPDGKKRKWSYPILSTTTQTVNEKVEEGTFGAVAMSTDGSEPEIETMTYKGGGSLNNYSSSNKGGSSLPKSSGGGGSSTPEPDVMDANEDEADRYHSIETQINKIGNSLDRLQSKQEKFVGQKLINNLNEQWALLNTQIENYNKKLGIAIQEQEELRSKLASKGVAFNEDGTIGNYASAFQAQQNYLNSLINQYNSMSAAGQESFKATVEAAQESFDKFKEDLDRYDELVSDFIPSIYDEIEQAFDQQIEINVQKFNMELEITLDMNEATREWNEWKKKVLDGIDEDDILGNSTAKLEDFYTYFNEKGSGDIQGLSKKVLADLEELKALDEGRDNVFGDDKQQGLDVLKEDYEQLMESLSNLIDLQDELYENIIEEMDIVQEKFDDQIESYEAITDMIEHDMKLIQLLYGEDSYGELAQYYELQQKNYEKQLEFQQQQKDFWYAQMQAAEQGSEAWETARDNWSNAVSEFNSLLESSLENATSKFENSINNIFKNLNNSVTNGMGLDYVQEEWELINKNAEQYLDTVNATYGIRELEKKYIESINNADSVKVQQQLKKAMDQQLENLKQKDKLTQYDLDRANKLYEIQLAQIALEEAQQNKSQMRLRRDSQGNYTYQYVADEDAIADAENQLANLYNDLYNFDKQKYQENLEQIYALWNEYQEKMMEAALINDPELRAEKELLIQEQYGELINGIVEENESIRNNLQESTFLSLSNLYEKDLMNFSDLTQQERDLLLNEVGGGFTQLLEIYGVNTEAFKNMTQEQQNALIDNIINGGFNKLLETYNLDLETFKNMTQEERDAMISNMGEAFNKMLELYGYDEESFKNLSKEKQDDLISKMGFTFETLSGFYDNDLEAFRKLTEDQQSILVESMVPQWNSAIQEMAKTFYGENGFEKNTIDAWNAIKDAQKEYQEDLDKLEEAAKENFESIKNGIDENIDIIQDPENGLLKANKDLIEAYEKELAAVIEVYNKVKDLRDMYAEAEQKAKDAAEAAYAYQQQEAEKNRQDAANQEISRNPAGGADEVITPVNPTPSPPPQPVYTGPQGNGSVDIGDRVTLTGKIARNSYASPTITPLSKYRGAQLYVQMKTDERRAAPYHLGTTPNYSSRTAVGWVNRWQISGYDTGGYTGEWNKDGKLAFLHQKELVLNEQDTKNMLNAVSIIRSLAYSLGTSMLSKLAGVSATGYSNQNTTNSALEQNVHIQAEFPNVKDASEIEEALNNLVNKASQRIMEK